MKRWHHVSLVLALVFYTIAWRTTGSWWPIQSVWFWLAVACEAPTLVHMLKRLRQRVVREH